MAERGPRTTAPDRSPGKPGKPGKTRETRGTGKTRKSQDETVAAPPAARASGKKKSTSKSQQKPERRVASRTAAADVASASQEVTVTLTTPENATISTESDAPEAAFSAQRPAADRTPQEGTAEGGGGSMFGAGATPQAGRIPVLGVTPQVDGGRWPA